MTDVRSVQSANIEDHDGISVIRAGDSDRDWNGLSYNLGISSRSVGARELSMNVATIPPGGIAGAHIHVGFEVGLFILEGNVRHAFGPGLRHSVENSAGDFIFIAPDVPHEVYNMSDTEPVVAVVARSSATQWDEIIPYDPQTDDNV